MQVCLGGEQAKNETGPPLNTPRAGAAAPHLIVPALHVSAARAGTPASEADGGPMRSGLVAVFAVQR